MGVPVVASAVSGIPELIEDGSNGVLVGADDPRALADAITRVLRAPASGAALAQRARATVVESFDNDRNLQLLCALLRTRGGANAGVAPAAAAHGGETVHHVPLAVK